MAPRESWDARARLGLTTAAGRGPRTLAGPPPGYVERPRHLNELRRRPIDGPAPLRRPADLGSARSGAHRPALRRALCQPSVPRRPRATSGPLVRRLQGGASLPDFPSTAHLPPLRVWVPPPGPPSLPPPVTNASYPVSAVRHPQHSPSSSPPQPSPHHHGQSLPP
ncbi:uncharacterized protein LOC127678046 [Apodemus sylvaticus]|uniref:uncharacterized protein LOC127678046 n=1 Tax=Apodemus sylvaticus TaxID=10129 RepID=UPI002244A598|nr:uncharacterized protein LOC127678046 [Apodemus sylvaticus]